MLSTAVQTSPLTFTVFQTFDHKFPEDWPRAMVDANLMKSPPAFGRGPVGANVVTPHE